MMSLTLLLIGYSLFTLGTAEGPLAEGDWGDGLKVKIIHRPDDCVDGAKVGDLIHYHYVGRLFETGEEFGKRYKWPYNNHYGFASVYNLIKHTGFDYNTPYIVTLGKGYIIPGMDRGLVGTCLYERRRITFPASLGYGQNGVGEKIPPNATLTFYIRMVKIMRNGRSLSEEDQSFVTLYRQATEDYTLKEYNNGIALMEAVIPLHHKYRNLSTTCLQKCRKDESLLKLTAEQKTLLNKTSSRMRFIKEYLSMASVAKCLRDCKEETTGSELKVTERILMKSINDARYYDYLQFMYYQVNDPVEGAKCAFTYYFMHPHDSSIQKSIEYFRSALQMWPNNFTLYREPGVSPQQTHYQMASNAYHNKEWLKAIDNFEVCFKLYTTDLQQCRAYCEDVLYINITGVEFGLISGGTTLKVDTMDTYSLMSKAIETVVQCRSECYRKVSTINGVREKGYLASIFNFLQFAYYSVGRMNDVGGCVASYQLLEPSDGTMDKNAFFYKSKLKVPEEKFIPRPEVVRLYNEHQMDLYLMEYMKNGGPPKKKGVRGDSNKPFDYHSEL